MRGKFGRRLERAIKSKDGLGSIRRFQAALETRVAGRGGRFGYSYPAINTYLTGEAYPSIEWIEEVSDLLSVSPAWLAFGEGETLQSIAADREAWRREQAGGSAAYKPPEVIEEDREELRRRFGVNPDLYFLVGLPPLALHDLERIAYRDERSLGGLASELLTSAIKQAAEGGPMCQGDTVQNDTGPSDTHRPMRSAPPSKIRSHSAPADGFPIPDVRDR